MHDFKSELGEMISKIKLHAYTIQFIIRFGRLFLDIFFIKKLYGSKLLEK